LLEEGGDVGAQLEDDFEAIGHNFERESFQGQRPNLRTSDSERSMASSVEGGDMRKLILERF